MFTDGEIFFSCLRRRPETQLGSAYVKSAQWRALKTVKAPNSFRFGNGESGRPTQQVAPEPGQTARVRSRARTIQREIAVLDHGDDQQGKAHATGDKHLGIHGADDSSRAKN
jgi:hypothetical protein